MRGGAGASSSDGLISEIIELPYASAAPASASPASISSPGHIDATTVGRCPQAPLSLPCHPVSDNIIFTHDVAFALTIRVSGAELNDKWTWRYYRPGGLFVGSCYFKIVPPGAPGNGSSYVGLVRTCTSNGQPQLYKTYPAGCPCDFDFVGGAIGVAGTLNAAYVSTWTAFVDFTNASNVTTANVAQAQIYLVRTPLVMVLHGFKSKCDGVATLRQNIAQQLEIDPGRVGCYEYDWQEGVQAGAAGLGSHIRWFVDTTDPTQSEVDIVAHSMGGLVARYWYEADWRGGVDDPAIGSIAMLGTPNLGVNITKYERWICPAWSRVVPFVNRVCTLVDIGSAILGVDPHSQAVKDFKPDSSEVLKRINDGFVLPVSPVFRAHAGVHTTRLGKFFSGPGDNDCFISNESTFGPYGVFGPDASPYRGVRYTGVSHTSGFDPGPPPSGVPFCGSDTLTNNLSVVQNLLPDIKPNLGFPALPANAPEAAGVTTAAATAAAAALPGDLPALHLAEGGVTDGVTNNHTFTVPGGRPSATFAALWIGGDAPPSLSVQVVRPGGTVVNATDSDVLEPISLDGSNDTFSLAGSGFTIANPAAGTWTIRVTGIATGTDGAPYLTGVFPESAVFLSASVSSETVTSGGPELVMAQLVDGGTAVAAAITARLLKVDGSEQTLTLVDDGTNGDQTAGDKLYSATVPTAGACGTVRLLLSADASGTSEGAAHREQVASFDVHIAGDAVRDPCNPDDDGDGLTDEAEVNTHRTSALSADSDGDGAGDPTEIAAGTAPWNPDTDRDGFKDKAATLHKGPANTDTSVDNCPLAPNASQANTDGNFVDLPSRFAYDDVTWPMSDAAGDACDTDDDNDRLSDAQEASLGPGGANHALCAAATANTDPAKADTDGDTYLDGAECALGFDPRNAASRPPYLPPLEVDADRDGLPDAFEASIGADPAKKDTDGDTISDGVEFMFYGTNPNATNSDGDACSDVKEVASVNGDSIVSASDIGLIAGAFGPNTSPNYVLDFDVNKDGVITAGDVGFAAAQFGAC